MKKPQDLLVRNLVKQVLPEGFVDQEVGKLGQRLTVLPEHDDGVLKGSLTQYGPLGEGGRMTVTLTAPGEGEEFLPVRSDSVLEDGAGVDKRFGVAECYLPPGWPGPPQHIHRAHDKTFFVVTGTVLFTSGTDELLAPAGSLVTAPIGDPHTFGNADVDAPASLLCTVTPERYLGYFRDLRDLRPGPDSRLNPSEVLGVMARYETEPYRSRTGACSCRDVLEAASRAKVACRGTSWWPAGLGCSGVLGAEQLHWLRVENYQVKSSPVEE